MEVNAVKSPHTRSVVRKESATSVSFSNTKSICWEGIFYSVVDRSRKSREVSASTKTIISNVSGLVLPGELLAVMGPSGCGKSTLLDCLAGRLVSGDLSGQVLVDGILRGGDFRYICSYVAQEDTLIGTLTVYETLMYAVDFVFMSTMTKAKKSNLVIDLIDDMGLKECTHARIGDMFFKGISGGQKRKVSMAIELLKNPPIILLDEPTSGLDSVSAFSVVSQLSQLALNNHTILCTIHQPSSEVFHKFDKLLLLSQGRTVYFGGASAVVEYFEQCGLKCPEYSNPADFALAAINVDFPGHADVDKMISSYATGAAAHGVVVAIRAISKMPQLVMVVERDGESDPVVVGAVTPYGTGTEDGGELGGRSAVVRGPPEVQVHAVAGQQQQQQSPPEQYPDSKQLPHPSTTTKSTPPPIVARPLPTDTLNVRAIGTTASIRTFWSHFWTLSHRSALNSTRSVGLYGVRAVMYGLLGLAIGTLCVDLDTGFAATHTRAGLLTFCGSFMTFMSMAAVPFFIENRAVFVRERINGTYGVGPFVLSHFLVGLLPLLLIAVVASFPVFYIAGLHEGRYVGFLITLWLTFVCAEACTSLMSALAPHYIVGMALTAGLYGMFILCEGFLIIRDNFPIYWVWGYHTSFLTYSFRAFMYNEFHGMELQDAMGGSLSGDQVLRGYSIDPDIHLWKEWTALLVFSLLYEFAFLTVLYKYHRGYR